ncbi:MAG: Nif3-like dinuclear metal center hexameric protein [Planctomycetaceae bacterium]
MPTVRDIVQFFDQHSPTHLAEEWDNTGLLLGLPERPVRKLLTCLTLSPDVAAEARDQGVDLVVTHHPIFFKPVKRLTGDDLQQRMILELAQAGVAVFSAHTRFDSAREGINQHLAETLGLRDIAALEPASAPASYKLVVMVPRDHVEQVRRAMWDAGAGVIGQYTECSFVMPGTGSFRGGQESHPAIGEAGKYQTVEEYRIDMVCPAPLVDQVITAMKRAHPYEETAYDIVPRRSPQLEIGVGRFGVVPEIQKAGETRPPTLAEFLDHIKQVLNLGHVQYAGRLDRPVRRAGVACGAGGEFWRVALKRRCDVLLTGEARFHTCLEARDSHCALALVGHYATERPAMETLAQLLTQRFPTVQAWPSRVETDALQTR